MPCTVELVPVDPSLVAGVWPHARALVKSAMDRTDLGNFGDVEREVLGGMQQLWLVWNGTAIEAAAVTRLVLIGSRKICIIVACGGSGRKRWLPLIAGIEQFARNEGCRAVRIIGRKGWQRILADYRANYVVMDREL
jgi:hypothetical protein